MSYYEHDDALRSMLRQAHILKVDDSGPQQLVDLMGFGRGDKPKKVYRQQDYGFTSTPMVGSEGSIHAHTGRSDKLTYRDGGHQKYRPKDRPPGSVALYDHTGQIISIIEKEIRFVSTDTIYMKSPKIVMESASIKLGSASASRPVSAQGTTDSAGDTDSGNFAAGVFVG